MNDFMLGGHTTSITIYAHHIYHLFTSPLRLLFPLRHLAARIITTVFLYIPEAWETARRFGSVLSYLCATCFPVIMVYTSGSYFAYSLVYCCGPRCTWLGTDSFCVYFFIL